jgi:4-carboxymuconolactone decarboxylase
MATEPSVVQKMIGDIAPKLAEITDEVLFGDVWERPEMVKRDRSLITLAALIAMNRLEQLPFHLAFALDNGVTRDELVEEITHLAFYSGWPTAMSALAIAKRIFDEKA